MKIDLSEAEVRFVLAALGTQPWNQVNGLIAKIVDQAEAHSRLAPRESVALNDDSP